MVMITKNSGSFATGKNQLEAMWKCLTDRKLSFGVLGVVPRLVLVPLVCFALLVAGVNRSWAAAASSPIPYKDSYLLQFVSQSGSDQVYVGVGTNTVGGSFTIVVQVHLAARYYDPISNSYVTPFTGSETISVSNGDSLLTTFSGAEVAPLPPSPPFAVGGSEQIIGGTGRFSGATGSLTFTGLDFNNGTITVSTTGTISTVGSTKTGS